uniref:Glyco_trans_2-like domain-containing protein n=1 Tax=Caenorhabditis tropicalis TaxID=1561998 RepID=A0A1I7UU61_9PELO
MIQKDEYLKLENQFFDARPENSDNLITMEMLENEYCIGYNFLKATKSFREPDGLEPVTLATHATSDMINELENIPEMWDGPISIALFLDVQSQNALIYLSAVHRCVPGFREKVGITSHCLPNDTIPKIMPSIANNAFKRLLLMRNVARKGAMTDLHFIMDADMIVSEGMAQRVKKIANEMIDGDRKTVLLVRRFENDHVDIPRNVGDLEEALREERTFEFHHAFYSVAHKIENLDSWIQYSTTSSEITTWPIQYPTLALTVVALHVILHTVRHGTPNPDPMVYSFYFGALTLFVYFCMFVKFSYKLFISKVKKSKKPVTPMPNP